MTQPPEPATIKLSEAAKIIGVSLSTLRLLGDQRVLPGMVIGDKGHLFMRVDSIPTFARIEELLLEELAKSIRKLRHFYDRVKVELEAVGNDLAELEDDPRSEIGVDLGTLDSYSVRGTTTLNAALRRLTDATLDLQAVKRELGLMRLR